MLPWSLFTAGQARTALSGGGTFAEPVRGHVLAGCCLPAGGATSGPATTGIATAIAAATAMLPAALKTRRRRALMPARSALSGNGPIGGSPARALPISVRSVVSSMAAAPQLLPVYRRHARGSGFGHRLAQHYPQLVQSPGAELLDVARGAAHNIRHLVHAQVRPVAQHHHGPA